MNFLTLAALLLLGIHEPNAPTTPTAHAAEEKELTVEDISYAIGFNIGQSLRQDEIQVDVEILAKGIAHALTGKPEKTEEEMASIMQRFQMEAQAKREQKMQAELQRNKEAGDKFLAENKAKPGVITTASGLQYRVITEGKGNKASANDTVTVHYEGKLLDGSKFDSSYDRNTPATFPANGVIKGWQEALQLMNEGTKLELFIPADLAYGPRGAGGKIPPNAVLNFQVELIKIESKVEAEPATK